MSTDEQRSWQGQCSLSRFEVRDGISKKYIASIAYHPRTCSIEYLSVDKEYRKKGIGSELKYRAIQDMRANHSCRNVFLVADYGADGFWEKLGAKPTDEPGYTHVFPEPPSRLS